MSARTLRMQRASLETARSHSAHVLAGRHRADLRVPLDVEMAVSASEFNVVDHLLELDTDTACSTELLPTTPCQWRCRQ